MEQTLVRILDLVNEPLGYLLLTLLICCAVWFTFYTRGVQFRLLGEMFRVVAEAPNQKSNAKAGADGSNGKHRHIGPLEAFMVGLASRVGTGNLAGVATAIAIGGPGAVFWMWVMALLAASNAYVESTLAQLFKVKGRDSYIGGPAYYIEKGLGKRWFAVIFALAIVADFGLTNNLVQSNTISIAFTEAFGTDPWIMAVVLCAFSLLIIFGGIGRISRVCNIIVPGMALVYLVLTVYVVLSNITLVPDVLKLIVSSAFGLRQATGATIGMTILIGFKRGLFSNEAGEGSAPQAAATAETSHPAKQGLIQTLGVYVDTLVVCSCTAFLILVSGLYANGESGIALTQSAMSASIGDLGHTIIAVLIFFFAFSSILGNYFYGETNVLFLARRHPGHWLLAYRIAVGIVVFIGALATLNLAWGLVDFFMAIMTICNIIAIMLLGKYAIRCLDDYVKQRKAGKNPTYHKETIPEIQHLTECW